MDLSSFSLLSCIVSLLHVRSVLSLLSVSKALKSTLNSQLVWNTLFERDIHVEETSIVQEEYNDFNDWLVLYKRFYKAQQTKPIKLLFVGDTNVGKTSLVQTLMMNEFPTGKVPNLLEKCILYKRNKQSIFRVELVDTLAGSEYSRLTPLRYPGTDVVLMCFSTVGLYSFSSISDKWYPDMAHYLCNAPKLLVGTKIDVRNKNEKSGQKSAGGPIQMISQERLALAKRVRAVQYLEVSSRTKQGLHEALTIALDLALKHRSKNPQEHKLGGEKNNNCMLL